MKFYKSIKNTLKKLDRYSPYPLLYPFIMSAKEKAVFDHSIKNANHYLEFGLGGSTLRAIQKSKSVIYTVESSPAWVDEMRRYWIVRNQEKSRLHIFPVNIGPVKDWGYPESENFKENFETYSSGVYQSIDCTRLDLALIDGRFRVACTLKAILECEKNSNFKILIHDFWNRPHYHSVLKYLDTIKKVDTIGLFTIKSGIDRASLMQDYEAFKMIAD